jgi:putative phosphoribosyl transferase
MSEGFRSFAGRLEAGEELAAELAKLKLAPPVHVLALPRGGVPVASPVARRLATPLDVLVVRKIGMPGQPELAIGAIATGGIVLHNEELPLQLVSDAAFERVVEQEREELQRRERLYRAGRPPLDLSDGSVILVDDGLATGSTMLAAIRAARALGARTVIVAVPVASTQAAALVRDEADRLVALYIPEWLGAIGQFYDSFGQTSDAEVLDYMQRQHGGKTRTASGGR